MRKLALQMQGSVDGFVAGPNGELDWVFRSRGDDATAWIVDRLWQAGVHIMGRRTYHDMAAHWPTSTEPYFDEIAHRTVRLARRLTFRGLCRRTAEKNTPSREQAALATLTWDPTAALASNRSRLQTARRTS